MILAFLLLYSIILQEVLYNWAQFLRTAKAQEVAQHNKSMLTKITIPAKLCVRWSDVQYVTGILLISAFSRQELINYFCLSSSMKLAPWSEFINASVESSFFLCGMFQT